MSISAMTNAALGRRLDFELHGLVPDGYAQIAQVAALQPSAGRIKTLVVPTTAGERPPATPPPAAAPPSPPSNPAASALHVIAAYIPTEVLTLYVAVLGALHPGSSSPGSLWVAFGLFAVLTPLIVWVVYATKVKSAGKDLPLALPQTPFAVFESRGWYSFGAGGPCRAGDLYAARPVVASISARHQALPK